MGVLENEEFVGNFLEHFGVRGMHWGQRRAERKVAKQAHADWLKDAKSETTATAIFHETVKSANRAQKVLNNDPAFKGKDLSKDPRLAREYDRIMTDTFNEHMTQISINKTLNKQMDRAVRYQFDRDLGMMRAMEVKIQHDTLTAFPNFRAIMDDLGQVVSFELIETSLAQGADFADNFLAHFGVRGMRWGHRKDGSAGSRHTAKDDDSEDFTRTAAIAVKAKSGGTRALSNRELRDLVDRINLEQNFARINTPEAKKQNPLKPGIDYVSGKIKKIGDITVDTILKTAVQVNVDQYKGNLKIPAKSKAA